MKNLLRRCCGFGSRSSYALRYVQRGRTYARVTTFGRAMSQVRQVFPNSNMYDTTIIPKTYAFYTAKGKNGIVNINNIELRWIMEYS
jgi:hypothetical protein